MLTPVFQPIIRPIVSAIAGASRGGLYNGPSLALRFGENQYLMGAIGKKPDAYQPEGLITFARSTAAWEWDWQGNYSGVAAGVMRIAHDPLTKSTSATPQTLGTGSYTFATTYQYAIGAAVRVSADAANWMVGRVTASTPDSVTIWVSAAPTGAGTYSAWTLIVRRGIRVEEQRTNLLLRSTLVGGTAGTVGSGAVSPTGWTFPFTGGSVSYPTSPFGTGSVAFTKTLTTARPFIQQSIGVLASTTYTLSCRVSQSATGTMRLGDVCAWATLPAGATQAYYKNGVLTTGSAPESLKLGDVISSVLTVSTTAGTAQARVGLGAAGDPSVTGTVSLTMPQIEAAATPSSHIPTEGSQVIRAADVPNVNTLAPWFNPLEGLLVARVIRESISPSQTLVALSGTSISTISLESGAGNPAQLRMRVSVDGVQVAIPIAANSSAAYTPIKMAAAYKQDFFSVSANGAPPAEDTSGTVPVVTRLEIGSVNNAARLNGIIEDITYHPRVKDAQQAAA